MVQPRERERFLVIGLCSGANEEIDLGATEKDRDLMYGAQPASMLPYANPIETVTVAESPFVAVGPGQDNPWWIASCVD